MSGILVVIVLADEANVPYRLQNKIIFRLRRRAIIMTIAGITAIWILSALSSRTPTFPVQKQVALSRHMGHRNSDHVTGMKILLTLELDLFALTRGPRGRSQPESANVSPLSCS